MLSLVGDDYDLILTRLMLPRMSTWDAFYESEEGEENDPVARRQLGLQRLRQRVVPEFWRMHPTPELALAELDRRLIDLLACDSDATAADVLCYLLEAHPDQVEAVTQGILDNPDRPTNNCFGICLCFFQLRDAVSCSKWARNALESGNQVLCRAVSHHYCWQRDTTGPPLAADVAIVQSLLVHPDETVRRNGVGALRKVLHHDARAAIDMALAVDVGDSEALAIELCKIADADWQGRPEEFTNSDYQALLGKLDRVNELDYSLVQFMTQAVIRIPDDVVGLLLRRIEHAVSTRRNGYHAIPFDGLRQLFESLEGHPQHAILLQRTRDASLPKNSLLNHDLGRLYRSLSLDFDTNGLAVLQEWVDSGERERIEAVASLLREANNSFVFQRSDFVVHMLERAEQCGEDCIRTVSNCFYSVAIGGTRTGTPGKPFSHDIAMRDRARTQMNGLSPGTSAYRLFEQVLRSAERDIRQANLEGEEMED